jgi:pantothenate kinase, type III
MIVIDIGNSDTVIGIYKKKKLYKIYRTETKNKNFEKNIFQFFKKNIIINLKSDEKICVISSVVPEVNKIIFFLLKKYNFKIKNINIYNIPKKIKFKYSKNQLGADRIANSFSGMNKYGSNLMIIDFGTATTFDVIKNNIYIGGTIAPGILVSHKSLIKKKHLN